MQERGFSPVQADSGVSLFQTGISQTLLLSAAGVFWKQRNTGQRPIQKGAFSFLFCNFYGFERGGKENRGRQNNGTYKEYPESQGR